jgi:tetratricopeptide (TPR) repeat protein
MKLSNIFNLFKSDKDNSKVEATTAKKKDNRLLVLETILHGSDKFHEGEYKKAIHFFDLVLSIDPDNREYVLFYYRACSKYRIDDSVGALEDINKALQIKPTSEAFNEKGLILLDLGDKENAMDSFDKSIQLDNKNIEAYENRADLKSKLKDKSGAFEDYNTIIGLDPLNSLAFFYRGCESFSLSNYEEAINDLDTVIELGLPDNSHIHLNQVYSFRGSFKMLLRLYDLATEDFSMALTLKPTSVSDYFDRAEAYFNLENYDKAIADFDEIIKLQPDSGKAYYKRSKAKAKLMHINSSYGDEAVLDKIKAHTLDYDDEDDY